MTMIRTISDRLLLLLLSALAALIALMPLEWLGVFGSSFEGQSGYAALYFGFPVLTVVFALLAVRFMPRPLPVAMRIVGWVVLGIVILLMFA
ncbi:hypothetical protein HGG72_10810 [Ochrobactrum pecoris]|uniref:Membrane protein n=1 Tax=Brucella pecoris TaxID=867683 RepID=A0A5C5CU53_9HYPH|nr:hypothetical protein [Brucella pecoris]MBB4092925.1 putative membrane protein [Brucella pecoris]NKW80729.1 hypothetical protein [Brucella pecoris]TNV14728.1 hypothetical protein FIB18_05795 [Brucella pecoris]